MTSTEPACVALPSNANLRIEKLPFADIPSHSKLFLDVQRDATALRRYYPNAMRHHWDAATYIPQVLSHYPQTHRHQVCDALERLNRSYNAGEATLNNINRLRDASCVAVVTGQQVGLLTGPLYTIYKALSAVKLAECLAGRGLPAVPVFWMATEDHDWREVRETEVIGCDGRLARVELKDELHKENASVGAVVLDRSVDDAIKRLSDVLPSSEFTPQVIELVRASYTDGANYGSAFARLMTQLFVKHGLILLDPLDAELKQLTAPVYAAAATRADEIARSLVARSHQLEAEGYHAQVSVTEDSFPLFAHTDTGDDFADASQSPAAFARRALTRTPDNRYAVKGISEAAAKRTARTADEWAEIIKQYPARFSPNVTLRSVVQDYLLPTATYFGGAAEVAYFAQTSEVYRILNRPATPVLHRASLTIVERRTARTLERYDLRLTDFFDGLDTVITRVVREHLGAEASRAFDETEQNLETHLARLGEELRQVDATLGNALAHAEAKIKYQLESLRTRFTRAQMGRDRAAHRQLERAATALYPADSLQERHINILSLVARHGLYCLDWLYDAVDLSASEHVIVYL